MNETKSIKSKEELAVSPPQELVDAVKYIYKWMEAWPTTHVIMGGLSIEKAK